MPESPLLGPMREASVATKEDLSSPRSLACELARGEASTYYAHYLCSKENP